MATTADDRPTTGRTTAVRTSVATQFRRLVLAIREGDDAKVEAAVLSLSRRNRYLAPLAMLVGAVAVLFQGVKLLVTNWRLTLVEILPAMVIWAAMLDLKLHVLHGRPYRVWHGPLLVPTIALVALLTAGSFYLNAVFAFAVAVPGEPQIRPAFATARRHARTILAWGLLIGVCLGLSTLWVDRFGKPWFGFSLGATVAMMMFAYVAVPSRLVGVRSDKSRRVDQVTASALAGAVGAMICSPPYFLGRLAIVLLGVRSLRVVAVLLLVVAVVLQTGATSAIKAIKMSAKLTLGRSGGVDSRSSGN